MNRKKAYFSISAVAQMFSVHQQTIRLYEKEGLIRPKRSEGNTRLFSEEDIDRLEQIIYLTHQLGVNLAGVEMILKLQKKIKKLQKELNKVLDAAHDQLEMESQSVKKNAAYHAKRLHFMKEQGIEQKTKEIHKTDQSPDQYNQPENVDNTDWQIEYEE